jgi:hypothetical protein
MESPLPCVHGMPLTHQLRLLTWICTVLFSIPGGPVIDLMNRRLQHRLTEPEILKIFSNVCEVWLLLSGPIVMTLFYIRPVLLLFE